MILLGVYLIENDRQGPTAGVLITALRPFRPATLLKRHSNTDIFL